jgi:cytochrome c553
LIPLDGGECKGVKSATDMKNNGFTVEDIKITASKRGLDYIYIFKTNSSSSIATQEINTKDGKVIVSKAQLKQYLKDIDKENKAKEEEKKKHGDLALGEKLYKTSCSKCHGEKASISAYGKARPLKELSVEEIQTSIRDYVNNDKDNGLAILMTPYANKMDSLDVLSVANYIQTLK